MGAFGVFLAICWFLVLMVTMWDVDKDDTVYHFIMTALFVISFVLIIVDASSPVETTESYILTNDYQKYSIEIKSDKIGKIKVINKEATNSGAIFGYSRSYEFIDFYGEDK